MLMKKLLPLSALALVTALGGCKNPFFGESSKESTTENKKSIEAENTAVATRSTETISAEDLNNKIEKNDNNLVVINVLDENQFNDSHIKGSINIPFEELKEKAAQLDKNKEYVVYCGSFECPLSTAAFHILKEHDLKLVHEFEGGMKEWKEKGFAVEGGLEHADHQK